MVDVAFVNQLVLNPWASGVVWVPLGLLVLSGTLSKWFTTSGRDGCLVISFQVASEKLKVSSTTST